MARWWWWTHASFTGIADHSIGKNVLSLERQVWRWRGSAAAVLFVPIKAIYQSDPDRRCPHQQVYVIGHLLSTKRLYFSDNLRYEYSAIFHEFCLLLPLHLLLPSSDWRFVISIAWAYLTSISGLVWWKEAAAAHKNHPDLRSPALLPSEPSTPTQECFRSSFLLPPSSEYVSSSLPAVDFRRYRGPDYRKIMPTCLKIQIHS
jgi:hypothetical protein